MINAANERVWVKFHFKTAQGIKNFSNDEAVEMKGKDPDFAQRDLVAIDRKEYPKWNVKIQVMTLEEAKTYKYNPFDLAKCGYIKISADRRGVLELNENQRIISLKWSRLLL
jgi:catalase